MFSFFASKWVHVLVVAVAAAAPAALSAAGVDSSFLNAIAVLFGAGTAAHAGAAHNK